MCYLHVSKYTLLGSSYTSSIETWVHIRKCVLMPKAKKKPQPKPSDLASFWKLTRDRQGKVRDRYAPTLPFQELERHGIAYEVSHGDEVTDLDALVAQILLMPVNDEFTVDLWNGNAKLGRGEYFRSDRTHQLVEVLHEEENAVGLGIVLNEKYRLV